MKKRAIGLELTDQMVILCEIEQVKGIIQVKRQEMAALPSDVIAMGEIRDAGQLSQRIASILPKRFFLTTPLIVSITGLQAFVRTFLIPSVPDREIAGIVHWEGENILPYPIIEAFYHYQVMERTVDGCKVLFAAQRRERVEPYLRLFDELGLMIRELTLHPFGLTNYLEFAEQLGHFTGILARYHSSELELVVFHEGKPELVRTVMVLEQAGLYQAADLLCEEVASTVDHFQTERGIRLCSGIFFGSVPMMHSIRTRMPAYRWRHCFPSFSTDKAADSFFEPAHLHQELPCALGLAVSGVIR